MGSIRDSLSAALGYIDSSYHPVAENFVESVIRSIDSHDGEISVDELVRILVPIIQMLETSSSSQSRDADVP